MINWKQNLIMVWLSQFISILGFSIAMPFFPFYIQELGVTGETELKFWVALVNAAGPLTMAFFAPLWGAVADRYGRRLMMLRANVGGAVVLALMGVVPNVQWLFVLRLIQGTLTGTVTAAQTLVSVHTPDNRSGLALGILSSAVFTGHMVGNFAGGCVAEMYGYRMPFFCSGGLLLISTGLILWGVEEEFVSRKIRNPWRSFRVGVARVLSAWSILALIGLMAFSRHFDAAMFPLFVQKVKGTLKGAALWTGSLNAICSVAALLAGLMLGSLADRVAPPKIGKCSAFGAAVFMIVLSYAGGFLSLAAPRFGMVFCAGGLDPVFQIWLAKVTPQKSRGVLFGWALTCKSLGWAFSPLASGVVVATKWQFHGLYFAGAACFLALIPMISLVVRRMELSEANHQPEVH
ncbi:MAG: MFS transporter [Planctomycetota bacterium]